MSDAHQDEYDANMIALLELFWGKAFMAPGGEGNVNRILDGLDLRNKQVLEIGSGLGGGALLMAKEYGAQVIGFEVEAALVDHARKYAAQEGLQDNIEFRLVEPGPLDMDDGSVDVVYSSGVFIHIEDKPELFRDILRVLRPGGVLAAYDWLKGPGPLSEAMHEWIRLEELTFYLDTLENYRSMLEEAGFDQVTTTDASSWYTREARREYELMKGSLFEQVTRLIGKEKRDHFIEDWAAMVRVLESGELRSGYIRAQRSFPQS